MIYCSHDFLNFFSGKCSDNPENFDWAPSLFNRARAAPKAKLVMKDQSHKSYEKLYEKRDKSMKKKKLSTEEENILLINNQLSENNTDIDLVITSCTESSVKDTENQLLQQELNESKTLLLKYQMDLRRRLGYQVKNTKNVFFFSKE